MPAEAALGGAFENISSPMVSPAVPRLKSTTCGQRYCQAVRTRAMNNTGINRRVMPSADVVGAGRGFSSNAVTLFFIGPRAYAQPNYSMGTGERYMTPVILAAEQPRCMSHIIMRKSRHVCARS